MIFIRFFTLSPYLVKKGSLWVALETNYSCDFTEKKKKMYQHFLFANATHRYLRHSKAPLAPPLPLPNPLQLPLPLPPLPSTLLRQYHKNYFYKDTPHSRNMFPKII